jgi:ribosomal protein S1
MKDYTILSGTITKVTEKAVLVELDGDEKWIPRSQIEDGDTIDVGSQDFAVTTWFAKKEGFE